MKTFPIFLLFVFGALKCIGQVPMIDFSKSHSANVVTESGVEYKLFEGRNRFIRIENQDVRLRFPGGRIYELRVDRGSFDINGEDEIVSSRLITELMPTQEAAELMRTVKKSISVPTNDVDRWVSDIDEGKHKYPLKFEDMSASTGWNHYPAIIFNSKSSQNPTYEWNFTLTLRWTPERYPEGWNEEKAAANNPKPPAGYEVVSLNPPSGRFYSRKEGFEIAYDIDLDKPPEVNPEPASESEKIESKKKEPAEAEAAPVEIVEETPEQSSQWWLWLVGALVVVGGLGLVARRKS